jgi:glycolate oxidase FAD binding subunit
MDAVLTQLSRACRLTRAAEDSDAVLGVTPRYVASPADAEEASALMRVASGNDLAVVPRGLGTKLGWGTPPTRCDLVIDTSRLDKVVEHAAGDLITRVQAGVSLDRVAETAAGAHQQLSLDPPPGCPSTGTIGGVLATGVAGPRRWRYGTPRDLVIGLTLVRADGIIARSGGKVVKNVAGYDLGKLFAGSYGTLGLIVDAVMRLHPQPAAVSYAVTQRDDAEALSKAVAAVAGSELAATAIEVDRESRNSPARIAVLLEGDPSGIAERSRLLAKLLGEGTQTGPAAPDWWGRSGPATAPGTTLVKFAFWAAALPRAFAAIDAAGHAAGVDPVITGSAATGVLYGLLGPETDPAAVTAFVSGVRAAIAAGELDAHPHGVPCQSLPPSQASAVVLTSPPEVRRSLDPWGPVPGLALMHAVKDQFDPGHIMAPGRFAGGI